MSRQKNITAEYLVSMSELMSDEQIVLLALIAQSDDEGRGLSNPEVIRANNPQAAANMASWDVASIQESFLEGKQFCTRNHPTPSKLPAPPLGLLPALPQPAPARGRPQGSASAKSSPPSKASSKRKAAPAPAEKWSAPEYPEATYKGFQSIFNEVLGPHVGHADYITRNAHRNIDLSIRKGYEEDDFRRACEIGAKLDWFCRRTPGKTTPTNLETTCAPKTIEGLLNGRYGTV